MVAADNSKSLSESPLVSVIIPTCGRIEYLKEALDSVLRQTYPDLEIIVALDGPSPETESHIAGMNDSRIRLFSLTKTGLPSATRNAGLRNATGEWIAFLDDDDLWEPEKTQKQLEGLHGSSCRLSYTFYDAFGPLAKNRGRSIRNGMLDENAFDRLIEGNCISLSSVLMHRSLLDEIGFFEESPQLRAGEDWEYWLRAARVTCFCCVSEMLNHIRAHASTTEQERHRISRSMKAVYEKLCALGFLTPEQDRRMKGNYLWRMGEEFWMEGNRRGAVRAWRRSLCIRPRPLRRWVVAPLFCVPARLLPGADSASFI